MSPKNPNFERYIASLELRIKALEKNVFRLHLGLAATSIALGFIIGASI